VYRDGLSTLGRNCAGAAAWLSLCSIHATSPHLTVRFREAVRARGQTALYTSPGAYLLWAARDLFAGEAGTRRGVRRPLRRKGSPRDVRLMRRRRPLESPLAVSRHEMPFHSRLMSGIIPCYHGLGVARQCAGTCSCSRNRRQVNSLLRQWNGPGTVLINNDGDVQRNATSLLAHSAGTPEGLVCCCAGMRMLPRRVGLVQCVCSLATGGCHASATCRGILVTRAASERSVRALKRPFLCCAHKP
jgi:hypothetical protein